MKLFKPKIETPRLFLREITPDDAETAYLLNLDPEVIRYTGDPPFASVEEARKFLEHYDHYSKYGFGRWGVINKADNEFLGWCGLKYSEDADEHDIGFRFFKRHWNKGYASEAGKACLDFGFDRMKIRTIVGRAMKANTASIKVLEKIGLRYWKEDACAGQPGLIYRIDAPDQL